MRSAERLGPPTKPINLFYGFSQGARALAAARLQDNRGRLYGHGIEHHGSLDRALDAIEVLDSREAAGSFTTIARLLGSSSLPDRTSLGELLAALPLSLPKSSWVGRPHALLVEHMPQSGGAYLLLTPKFYARTDGWPVVDQLRVPDVDARRDWAQQYLRLHYPTLSDAVPFPDGEAWVRSGERGLQLVLRLDLDTSLGSEDLRRQVLYTRTHAWAKGSSRSRGSARNYRHRTPL